MVQPDVLLVVVTCRLTEVRVRKLLGTVVADVADSAGLDCDMDSVILDC